MGVRPTVPPARMGETSYEHVVQGGVITADIGPRGVLLRGSVLAEVRPLLESCPFSFGGFWSP